MLSAPRPRATTDERDPIPHRLGRASEFDLPLGSQFERGRTVGYPIDFREKALTPDWTPPYVSGAGFHRFIGVGQWGLGAYERHLAGEPGNWFDGLLRVGDYLLGEQIRSGALDGGWPEPTSSQHTFRIRGPWLSAMAQGECASLLARLYLETGRGDFAEAARRALAPFAVPSSKRGVQARLDGLPFPEEYPTDPASFVLNGAIFAMWGLHDVGLALSDESARELFCEATDMLAENLHRWDLGFWSRYDLYPHPGLSNVANHYYHRLHINQLRAFDRLEPRPQFAATATRFEGYAARRSNRVRALAHKVGFRLIVPRSPALTRRFPWTSSERAV